MESITIIFPIQKFPPQNRIQELDKLVLELEVSMFKRYFRDNYPVYFTIYYIISSSQIELHVDNIESKYAQEIRDSIMVMNNV